MNNKPLGRLERVDLRNYWIDEARDFTPWLSEAGNLALLSDTLGMELEFTSSEAFVGPYRTDILAMDLSSNTKVVIENQLEKTDHDHLGKSIVYAAGHDAKILIWIAREFSEEHRRAVDFLNENAAPDLRFFALEVQLWRIGSSDPAPLFKIVASPNDFSSTIRAIDKQELNETGALYLEFWNGFKEYCLDHHSSLPVGNRKPQPRAWFAVAISRSEFGLNFVAGIQSRWISCNIYIRGPHAKKALRLLKKHQAEIEAVLGSLDWHERANHQDCHIDSKLPNFSIADKPTWPSGFEWLMTKGELFRKTFYPFIKALPPLETIEEEDTSTPESNEQLETAIAPSNTEY